MHPSIEMVAKGRDVEMVISVVYGGLGRPRSERISAYYTSASVLVKLVREYVVWEKGR